MIFCADGRRTSVESKRFIKFSISAGNYSIDDFNAKIETLVLQERQDRIPPQIKDFKLAIPEHYKLMASNSLFIALGILDKYLKKNTQMKSTLPPGSYKTSLDTSPSVMLVSLHCKQINKVKNMRDGQPSSLIAHMDVSYYKATFSPLHLLFLESDTHRHHLDFKILDPNNNKVISRAFYLQTLRKL